MMNYLWFDLRSSFREYLLVYFAILISCIILWFGVQLNIDFIIGMSAVFYAFSVVILIVIIFLNSIKDFYHTMCGNKAQFTYSLPIRLWKIHILKLIKVCVWFYLSCGVIFISGSIIELVLSSLEEGTYVISVGNSFHADVFLFLNLSFIIDIVYAFSIIFLCITFVQTFYFKAFRRLLILILICLISASVSYSIFLFNISHVELYYFFISMVAFICNVYLYENKIEILE